MEKQNKLSLLQIVSIVGVIAVVLLIGYKIVTYNPIPKINKPAQIDVEKVGKKVGDIRRKFLKGYRDTTAVKSDSTSIFK